MASGWIDRPLGEIAAALRDGQLSAAALYEEARERHGRFGETLQAYQIWDETHARAQAASADEAFQSGNDAGPLQGIPVSVKDLFGVDYLDTFNGTKRALPEKWNAEAPVIRSLRTQGAVITGKTRMVECAFGGLGVNAHWPDPRNPWDAEHHRVSGGSSSGAGVSLIEGSALVAMGSDTMGSVRIPASVTGTVGVKVTAGRWPTDGLVPLSPTFDTPGVLTRTVADAALVFEQIDAFCAGRTAKAPVTAANLADLTIGIVDRHFWGLCSDDIASAIKDTVNTLEKAGATVVATDLPELDEAYTLFRMGSVVSSELRAFMEGELPDWIDILDPNISYRMSSAIDLDSDEIADRRRRIANMMRAAAEPMSQVDIIVSPTVPVTAARLEDLTERKAFAEANLQTLSNTNVVNMLGLCAITLPAALDAQGIPVGLQCISAAGREEKLLAIALAIEEKLGNARERLGTAPMVS